MMRYKLPLFLLVATASVSGIISPLERNEFRLIKEKGNLADTEISSALYPDDAVCHFPENAPCQSAEDPPRFLEWVRLADFPLLAARTAGCTDGRYHYLMGGLEGGSGSRPLKNLYRYDLITDSWVELESMPYATSNHCAVCHPRLKKIYIPGGYPGPADRLQEYDITSNTWSLKSPCPVVDYGAAGAYYGDSILVVFGSNYPGRTFRYSIPDDSWEERESAPGVTSHGQMVTSPYDGCLYYAGGWRDNKIFLKFDPSTMSWSVLDSMPTGRHGLALAAVGPFIYAYGGAQGWTPLRCVEVYNVATGTWTTEDSMPYAFGGNSITSGCMGWIFYSSGGSLHIGALVTPSYDIGVSRIVEPASPEIVPGVPITPRVLVKNYGLEWAESFAVMFAVESAGRVVYDDGVFLDSLAPGDSIEVEFVNNWTPNASLWHGYTISSFTFLFNDSVPWNDTCEMPVLVTSDTIYSNTTVHPPVIDGYLAPNEWAGAYEMNFSNVFGWYGKPYGPYAAKAWFMHGRENDTDFLYSAYALPFAATRNNGDLIGFYCDENNNGEWESTYCEGIYWFFVDHNGADAVLYLPITSGITLDPVPVPGAQSASGTLNGYLVFEAKVPIDTGDVYLNLNPAGDTAGLFLLAMDNHMLFGWWPAGMCADSHLRPAYYGKLILREVAPGIEEQVKEAVAGVALMPSPVVNRSAVLKYTLPNPGLAAVEVFDVTGRVVLSQQINAGRSGSLKLDLNHLANGVYLLRFEAEGFSTVRKFLIAR
ncbi:MAG: kelch repeat-containing protein [candidate division WOR-3 bacterium]